MEEMTTCGRCEKLAHITGRLADALDRIIMGEDGDLTEARHALARYYAYIESGL